MAAAGRERGVRLAGYGQSARRSRAGLAQPVRLAAPPAGIQVDGCYRSILGFSRVAPEPAGGRRLVAFRQLRGAYTPAVDSDRQRARDSTHLSRAVPVERRVG